MIHEKASDLSDLEILRLIREHSNGGETARSILYRTHHPNVVDAKFERLSKRGLTDWGVNVTLPWLTDKGKELLEHLEQGNDPR